MKGLGGLFAPVTFERPLPLQTTNGSDMPERSRAHSVQPKMINSLKTFEVLDPVVRFVSILVVDMAVRRNWAVCQCPNVAVFIAIRILPMDPVAVRS